MGAGALAPPTDASAISDHRPGCRAEVGTDLAAVSKIENLNSAVTILGSRPGQGAEVALAFQACSAARMVWAALTVAVMSALAEVSMAEAT
jgi:hypothetical protein